MSRFSNTHCCKCLNIMKAVLCAVKFQCSMISVRAEHSLTVVTVPKFLLRKGQLLRRDCYPIRDKADNKSSDV